jgi:hypothetical protein
MKSLVCRDRARQVDEAENERLIRVERPIPRGRDLDHQPDHDDAQRRKVGACTKPLLDSPRAAPSDATGLDRRQVYLLV